MNSYPRKAVRHLIGRGIEGELVAPLYSFTVIQLPQHWSSAHHGHSFEQRVADHPHRPTHIQKFFKNVISQHWHFRIPNSKLNCLLNLIPVTYFFNQCCAQRLYMHVGDTQTCTHTGFYSLPVRNSLFSKGVWLGLGLWSRLGWFWSWPHEGGVVVVVLGVQRAGE